MLLTVAPPFFSAPECAFPDLDRSAYPASARMQRTSAAIHPHFRRFPGISCPGGSPVLDRSAPASTRTGDSTVSAGMALFWESFPGSRSLDISPPSDDLYLWRILFAKGFGKSHSLGKNKINPPI